MSQNGEKFSVDTRYYGINDIVEEAIKQTGSPDKTCDNGAHGIWLWLDHKAAQGGVK